MDRGMLMQARDGVSAQIAVDKSHIVIMRGQMVPDGSGGYVVDPYSDPVPHGYDVRLSHDAKGPASLEQGPAGFTTNLYRFMTMDWRGGIEQNETFEWMDKRYMVGPVDPLTFMGAVIGYQAPLAEAV